MSRFQLCQTNSELVESTLYLCRPRVEINAESLIKPIKHIAIINMQGQKYITVKEFRSNNNVGRSAKHVAPIHCQKC